MYSTTYALCSFTNFLCSPFCAPHPNTVVPADQTPQFPDAAVPLANSPAPSVNMHYCTREHTCCGGLSSSWILAAGFKDESNSQDAGCAGV